MMMLIMNVIILLIVLISSSSFPLIRTIMLKNENNNNRYRNSNNNNIKSDVDGPGEYISLPSSITSMKKTIKFCLGVGLGVIGGSISSANASPSKISQLKTTSIKSTTIPIDTEIDNNIVIKSITDQREYKAITLNNGIRTLLISDPDSSLSAAALDVHVGAMSDPINVPGLAHFCEHMSFLGTKKFPKEDDYSSFLASHGGSSNAYTDSEDTVYYFDVNSDYLDEALDRFSQFFISPLFTASATSRELNAIDSEHSKNINSDGFRIYQIDKDGANPIHPLNKFSTGNKKTLETDTIAQGINVRDELLKFHSKYYSSNMMTLCVSGKDSLSALEATVRKCFSAVPNKSVIDPAIEWWGKTRPYLPQLKATALEIVPVNEIRRISIAWPIWIRSPTERIKLQNSKPEGIIAHLIGHEGKGSLKSLLTEKSWANGIQSNIANDVSDLQMLEVDVELTEEGYKNRYKIIEMIFAYIDMLKTYTEANGLPNYIYEEVKQLGEIGFNFAEKGDPSGYTSSLAADMQLYTKPSQYLTGARLISDPDPNAVRQYLNFLTPNESRIKVISQKLKGKTKFKGRFYGTEYNNITLSSETDTWSSVKASKYPQLHLPDPNIYVPTNFELLGEKPKDKKERDELLAAPPNIIREDDNWVVYHKIDRNFLQPKVYTIVNLAVPSVMYNADFVIIAKLYAMCFLDSINEELYNARLAGLTFELEFTSKGLQMVFAGYSEKIKIFAQRVMERLVQFNPDQSSFNRFKDIVQRELGSWKSQQPYMHCAYYSSLAMETLNYPIDELSEALKRVQINSVKTFLKSILSRSHGQALVMGNVDETGAKEFVNLVEAAFTFKPLSKSERSRRRPIELPITNNANNYGYRISRLEPNTNDENSAIAFYFQLPSRKIEDYLLMEILADAIEQPFYNDLRTKQQLGYIVYSGVRAREGIYSLAFIAQSSLIDGAELGRRVETFLQSYLPTLLGMSDSTFEEYLQGILVRKEEPDQRLTIQAGKFWSEISLRDVEEPLFDRYEREVKFLRKLKKEDFLSFCKKILSIDGDDRRLLISQITSQKANINKDNTDKYTYKEIDDELAFLNAQSQL